MVFPAPAITSLPEVLENFATDSSLDSTVNAPGLFDVGFFSTNDSSPKVRVVVVYAPKTGVSRPTINNAVIEACSKPFTADCVAVIVVVPAPLIVARPVSALTSTTSGLLEVNRQPPELFEDGSSMVNAASPNVTAGIVKRPSDGFSATAAAVPVPDVAAATVRFTVVGGASSSTEAAPLAGNVVGNAAFFTGVVGPGSFGAAALEAFACVVGAASATWSPDFDGMVVGAEYAASTL